MTVTYHPEVIQGSDSWLKMRLGKLTASEMRYAVTPTLKIADNDKTRAHVFELLAQRITQYVEPSYISDDMLLGVENEFYARQAYAEHYTPVETVGFITNDRWGFTLGYSPDGLVGSDGLIEVKSRRQKFQVETITSGEVPPEYMLQLQTGLLVSEREWIDFISYCGGLPMVVIRVHPSREIQDAIIDVAAKFEARLSEKMADYHEVMASDARLIPTERRIEQEMFV